MTISIDMPEMAANGLSENWLFKFCGNLHWQELCRALETRSAELSSNCGERLYPSFVAIAARYSAPLASVQENDRFEEAISIARFGSSFFHSRSSLRDRAIELSLDMITAFVARASVGKNDLKKAVPAARFSFRGKDAAMAPDLLVRSARLRKKELRRYQIGVFDISIADEREGLEERYEPSPYIDFNGANLLYYAAYPSICDIGERRLIRRHGLIEGLERDWALAASTVARDVFYYKNLDLGEEIVVRLARLEKRERQILTHTRLLNAANHTPIAELFTIKELQM